MTLNSSKFNIRCGDASVYHKKLKSISWYVIFPIRKPIVWANVQCLIVLVIRESGEPQLSPKCLFGLVATRQVHPLKDYYRCTRPITWKQFGSIIPRWLQCQSYDSRLSKLRILEQACHLWLLILVIYDACMGKSLADTYEFNPG